MPFVPSQEFKMYGDHPILGRALGPADDCQIYTRTVVLWAVNMTIDTESLWRFVSVIGPDNREVWYAQPVPTGAPAVERPDPKHPPAGAENRGLLRCGNGGNGGHASPLRTPGGGLTSSGAAMRHPVVRTVSTSTHRRGVIPKRMFSVPFRSVLSMDVEYRGAMPNLKISNRNTIQATGCQNMEVLSEILHYLVTKYRGRGFNPIEYGPGRPGRVPAFVGDIVLANVHFKLGWRVDRIRLRDVVNRGAIGGCVASYEPLVHDVSVSVKLRESDDLPNAGAVYPLWTYDSSPDRLPGDGWTTVRYQDVMRMVPHAAIKRRARCHTFRVFATGSVVQVGRWPATMCTAHAAFKAQMGAFRRAIIDPIYARQRTLDAFLVARRSKRPAEEGLDKHDDHDQGCGKRRRCLSPDHQPHRALPHPPSSPPQQPANVPTKSLDGPVGEPRSASVPAMDRDRTAAPSPHMYRRGRRCVRKQGRSARSLSRGRRNADAKPPPTVGAAQAHRAAPASTA